MNCSDTIFAVSSGSGMAGIAVIRLSGQKAAALLKLTAGVLPSPRFATVRQLRDPITKEIIDQALVLWMPGPNTVTGEDIAEFHVHGSLAVVEALFSLFLKQDGVRLAEAGEFTRRAFINGRMDLVEVEGLGDLLHARTEAQRRMALHHMLGDASSIYENWRGELIGILARLEAAIDFTDEAGVAEAALVDVKSRTVDLVARLNKAAAESDRAGTLRSGVKVVFAGAPNVGKSSLLNLVAAREAAIVSSRPGTTRDVIEVSIVLGGVPVILTDTAGLRDDSEDEIEAIGMARAKLEMAGADILVWLDSADREAADLPVALPALRVLNKMDLATPNSVHVRNNLAGDGMLPISVKTGEGIAAFLSVLEKRISERFGGLEHATVIRTRQKSAVEESIRCLNDSLTFEADQIEFAAECVRKAGYALARVTGRVDVEDLLGKIFSDFCIGK
jgi:tRNA modification GTPase